MIPKIFFLAIALVSSSAHAADRPNVLFIAVDDLNDWVGPLGGHPAAQTPHLDQFAEEGAMVFHNVHCPGPVCGPSRSALLSGFMPHTSGLYGNAHNMLDAPLVQSHATLPEYFSRNGYTTLSRGKIAHKHSGEHGQDAGHWMYDHWEPAPARKGASGIDPRTLTSRDENIVWGKPAPPSEFTKNHGSPFAFGMTKGSTKDTQDYLTAEWASTQLTADHDAPFFLAVGLSKPHLPFTSPQEFWDQFPEDGDYLPEIHEDDYDDILLPNGKPMGKKSLDYLWLEEQGLLNETARAYLVNCAYADHCLGVIFDALRDSPHADNTIVMVWGDHGWHLGEKLRYRKASLWSESTRCPLFVRLPGMDERGDCERPVNLIDLYPTLLELCGLAEKPALDGLSFAPLLKDPGQTWVPTLSIQGEGNCSVHDGKWNLISRKNGANELYDLEADPMETHNLHNSPEHAAVRQRLESSLPETYAAPAPQSKWPKGSKDLDETIRPARLNAELK